MAEPDAQAAESHRWIASAPLGAASVLADELRALGATEIRERSVDVKFVGPLELGLKACLWSRTASRVLLLIAVVDSSTTARLFAEAKKIDWRRHIGPGRSLACQCSGGNEAIRNSLFGSQLLKDAICDSLRESTGSRPDISPKRPDVSMHLHIEGARGEIAVDFAGESLHRHGYRLEGGRAPLAENVAAAALLRCGWPQIFEDGGALVDPLCGSGTFLIEAALIAADIAPGLGRGYYGFHGWRGFERTMWERLRGEAEARRAAREPRRCVFGSDQDPSAVRASHENARRAGVADWIHVEKRELERVQRPSFEQGLLIANPPYGERMGAAAELPALYAALGAVMRAQFAGWRGAVLTGNPVLAKQIGIFAERTHRIANGAIECKLLRFDLAAPKVPVSREERRDNWARRPGAQMFANRLRKNLKRLQTWARREAVDCFRAYDADMPEYAFAIDVYGADPRHLFVQEYAPPKTVAADKARDRRREALAVLPDVFAVPAEAIHARLRRPQKGAEQYEKQDVSGRRHIATEHGLKFWVNLDDYLDTGLFLDHRATRALLRREAKDADFLNLFCYTGSATVCAAAGGARSSLSIDLSNTYLDWTRDNMDLNALRSPRHELLRADCLQWLAQPDAAPAFDLVFLDPPTFSNSKSMQGVLDIERDHTILIRQAMRRLRADGQLIFSTNYSKFKLVVEELAPFEVRDITAETVSKDFERTPTAHRAYRIRHRGVVERD